MKFRILGLENLFRVGNVFVNWRCYLSSVLHDFTLFTSKPNEESSNLLCVFSTILEEFSDNSILKHRFVIFIKIFNTFSDNDIWQIANTMLWLIHKV